MACSLKRNIFEIIQPAEKGRVASKIFDLSIMALIVFSVVTVFVSTFDIPPRLAFFFERAEDWALIVFSAEYLLRV